MRSADFGEAMYLSAKIRSEIKQELERIRSSNVESLWIPVEERLPEFDGEYLITVHFDDLLPIHNMTKRCKFTNNFYERFGFGDNKPAWYRDGCSGYPDPAETSLEHIIAWMPYPSPYIQK